MTETTRVLIVEDHRMVADALGHLLAVEPGIELLAKVHTAEEALDHCARDCPDVVLMDVDLPRMSGLEAIAHVHSRCPDAQVVVITALQEPELLSQAVEAGACGFLPKTRAAEDLIDAVRSAARGEIVMPAEAVRPALRRMADVRPARSLMEVRLAQLTERERQVLGEMASAASSAMIAETLQISPQTAQSHIKSVITKLGVHSRLEAVLLALRHGVIQLPREA